MKKLLGIVIILAVAILMTLTVPDKKAHKEAMMKAIKEYVDEEAASMGIGDNGLARAGKNVVTKAIETILTSKLKETNYLLFNTTHIQMKEKDQLLSVGLFGQVITFNKDMLRKALEEAAEEKAEAKAEKKRIKEEAKAEKKRLKEEAKAEKKRQREQEKAQRKAEKEQRKAEKEQRKAEKEQRKAEKKRQRELEKQQKDSND